MTDLKKPLTPWLTSASEPLFAAYAITTSFSTYFCMYAFRKPFTAASFADETLWQLDLKTALVISQLLGYAISKFLGIKFCSEITPSRRATALVGLVLMAQIALVLFAVAPPEFQLVAIFFNGLPLGMVWGMVVGFLEGRRTSELLLAGLSCSFIVASGAVKDVGRWLMTSYSVTETWMPALTGFFFLPLFLVSVWLLNQIPQPSTADIEARVLRQPMDATHRLAFVRHFFLGLLMLFPVYFFLTAYRDFRDNYGVEIFQELGYTQEPALFTRSELPVAFGVILALAALNLIRDNRRGLFGAYLMMTGGTLLLGVSTLLLDAGHISGLSWMILVGLGSYLAYVPYGSVLFDRMIASTHVVGTAVFAIYVADAIGYTGSIGLQLYKDLGHSEMSRFGFFRIYTYFMSGFGSALLVGSCIYFLRRRARSTAQLPLQDPPSTASSSPTDRPKLLA